MSIPLHTGTGTVTVSSEWTVWDTRCRLVVTDPWAMHRARELLEEQVIAVDRVLRPRRRGRRAVHRDGCPPLPGTELTGLFGRRAARSVQPSRFPYGLAAAPPDVDVHQPAPGPAQSALDAAAARRAGMRLEPAPSLRARVAQRCAELVAEELSCGALVAFGNDVATSGLAPAGGWRVELRDEPGAPSTVVAVDGGAICQLGLARRRRRAAPCPVVVPLTGRTVVPVWRSITVAAADAPTASAACTSALLKGPEAAAWLTARGLPALLVDVDGRQHAVDRWPGESRRR